MLVNELYLEHFRNYISEAVEFSSGANIITGGNAQGKTNLIEAIYILAAGRSFRQASDKDLISFQSDSAYIKANIQSSNREQSLEARLFRERRRELFANGVKLKKVSDLTGRLTVVQFGPDDLDMIKDGAAVRRKLMDTCLSQMRPIYTAALSEFNKLYDNKVKILKNFHEKPSLLELLNDFNYRIAQQSARLIYYRTAFAAALSRRAALVHEEFSGGTESLTIKYKTIGNMDASGKKPDEILPEIIESQREYYQAELRAGQCLMGVQKDDLEIDINGISARKFGSQGQMRTAAVSIKLAERELHYDDKGDYPILLLDDVLSELDNERQSYILEKIAKGQVFITCCDENSISLSQGCYLIKVDNGKLKLEKPVATMTSLRDYDVPTVHDYCV
ncbi:MAG: DNA replication/repair protein RecF [Oscillospiraceae bacterium]|nr:DNA replication/repair protein RecF [Oscillospiraceae bacterium]